MKLPLSLSLLAALLWATLSASAQVAPAAAHNEGVATAADSNVPDPVHRGWSASLDTTGAHDSLAGWSLLETPSAGYRLNDTISMDVDAPFYAYINAVRTGKKGNSTLKGHTAVWGDTVLAGHFELSPDAFDYTGTTSFSAPTGNEHLGTGTGHLGWDVNNHFEREMGPLTPDVELGVGNTSALVRPRVVKSYASYGPLAFFQAGSTAGLPGDFSFDGEWYEQLPIGAQTVYSKANRKHGAVLKNASDAEDNGVNFELDAPAAGRIELSAAVAHSIRLDDTTVSLSLNFLLHVPKN